LVPGFARLRAFVARTADADGPPRLLLEAVADTLPEQVWPLTPRHATVTDLVAPNPETFVIEAVADGGATV
jgi:hypothetical protein